MFDSVKVEGENAFVPKEATWVKENLDSNQLARLINPLLKFFVVESPVPGLSSRIKTLESYGWIEPWKKPQYLNRKIKDCATNTALFWSAATKKDVAARLRDSGLGWSSLDKRNLQEIAVFYDVKKNQTMSVFYHLRNALAHGRFAAFKNKRDIWFVFEDVGPRGSKGDNPNLARLTARIVIKNSTLIKWIRVIQKGPSDE